MCPLDFGGGSTRFQSVYQRVSPGFETNDIGYQQRADQQMFCNWFALQFTKPTSWYRRANFNFNAQERWTTEGLVLGNSLNHNLHIQFPSQWWIHAGVNVSDILPAYGDRDARGGPAIRRSQNNSFWTGFDSDQRYTFARLNQTTISLGSRLNFTATPNLSFQFHGQPYVSDGTYGDWKELDEPRSSSYDKRFKKYGSTTGIFDGFNFREFRSNAVMRYEYRRGSTVFLVWQQGRSDYLTRDDEGCNDGYNLKRDFGSAFRDHPNNTFLVKWSYWINP